MLFEDNTFYIMSRFLLMLCGTFGMAASTTRFSRNYKRSLLLFSGYLLYALVSTYLLVSLWGYEKFLRIFIFTITIPAVLLMYFTSDEPLPRLVFTRITQLLFSVYVAGTATLLNDFLNGNMLSSLLLLLFFYVLAITLEFLFLRRIFMYIADTVREGWGILALIPCALTILEALIALYPKHYTENPTGVLLSFLLFIVILILYSVIFLYLFLLYKRQMSERNLEILELQVQNIRRENEAVEALAKQTKILRHDTRHMLSVIAAFAEKGDLQAVTDYIGRIMEEALPPDTPSFCSDPVLDATLSGYFLRAKREGFLLETSLAIPEALPADSAELAICFTNALECAMRLSGDIPEKERQLPEKRLIVRCIGHPRLMFEVSAPCRDNLAFSRNQFPKTENISLNLNLNSIREFCRRYDAVYSLTAENGRFSVQVAL